MDEQSAEEIYKDLFSDNGLGFSFCRLPMGANDFAESWYSYNETDGNFEMKNFSIERDRKYLIPAVKKAIKYSKNIEFFSSPWSPPKSQGL